MNENPNILFIYSDQHRYDCLGVSGHPVIQTPNLDMLARKGVHFTNTYTPIPMCVPARCSMLTGQWPTQHGTIFNFDAETWKPLPSEVPTISQLLRETGYILGHVGRWHVDPVRTPINFGFHKYIPEESYLEWRKEQGIPHRPDTKGFFGETDHYISPQQSRLAWSADQTISMLKEFKEQDKPFFLRWHFTEPHLPCCPPEPYASMYDPRKIEPWPGFKDSLESKPLIQKQQKYTWGIADWTWEDWAPIVSRYFGEVSLMDAQIGRVVAAVDELGIGENIIIVYTSDHGDMCGSHGMMDKHYIMYDDVVKVPMIMRWSGHLPENVVCDAFLSNAIDLPSTFCAVADIKPPQTFQGQNILRIALGKSTSQREDIFATWHGNQFGLYSQRMVRDRRYKYIWNATALDEFYDLVSDPGELSNLITDINYKVDINQMRKRLISWMENTSDPLLNPWIRDQLENGNIISK